MFKLLTVGNPKILKGQAKGYITFILHLAPAELSGYNTCPKATKGCRAACLNTAGRGGMFKRGESTNVIQEARKRKTRNLFENTVEFMSDLVADIERAIRKAAKENLIPVFRLNGTSDVSFEKEKYSVIRNGVKYRNIFEAFSEIQFYDYTKILGRKVSGISNYHLTFSAADGNDADVNEALNRGLNVAMVFDNVPEHYLNRRVINGDETDLRFTDELGVIVGLKAKGKAKKDTSGFVRKIIPLVAA